MDTTSLNPEVAPPHEISPSGGIFLCPELAMPQQVEQLIQSLPELLPLSHQAKEHLADAFKNLSAEYGDSLRLHNEPELSEDAVYMRLLRRTCEKDWKTEEESAAALSIIGTIEDLKSAVAAYDDARATVCGFGEQLVETLKRKLEPGSHLLGNHQYEVIMGRFGGSMHAWLCGFDQTTSERVYFNRWDTVAEPGARAAFLNDYIQLLGDVTWLV